METPNDRMKILEMIEEGRISAQEGLRLLQILKEAESEDLAEDDPSVQTLEELPLPFQPVTEDADPAPALADTPLAESVEPPAADFAPSLRKWKRWWIIPFWIGVAVTIFGGLFMFQAQQSAGIGFWFVCASVPFILGLVVMVLAYQSRNSPWLHLRVQQAPGEFPEKIAFSFPLPLGLAAWAFRTFRQFIPDLQGQDLGEMIQSAGGKISQENPIFIEVNEKDGERVEIYIG